MLWHILVIFTNLYCVSRANTPWADESENIKEPAVCKTAIEGVFCRPDDIDETKRVSIPECYTLGTTDDTLGQWITLPSTTPDSVSGGVTFNVSQYLKNEQTSPLYGENRDEVIDEFLTKYLRFWRPSDCRYHRFNRDSLQYYLEKKLNKRGRPLNVAFFGDSILRGVYCSLTRIVSGDELFGPNISKVCGGLVGNQVPVTFSSEGTVYSDVHLCKNGDESHVLLNASYSYIRFFHNKPNELNANVTVQGTFDTIKSWLERTSLAVNNPDGTPLEQNQGENSKMRVPVSQVDTLVLSSGAWPFFGPTYQADHGNHITDFPYKKSTAECFNKQFIAASKEITNEEGLQFVKNISDLANRYNIDLIYKNNHFNCRFGVHCADAKLEIAMSEVPNSRWKIWNTRPITEQHWRDQCWDGFHFDRQVLHTLKNHYRAWFSTPKGFHHHGKFYKFKHMAELEMQLINSLLNRVVFSSS